MSSTSPSPGGLSLIIVSYNTRDLLKQCLRSIVTHEPGAQVIVVDNASRDGSIDMVRSDFPGVACLEMGWNAGFAAANNAGLKLAEGEFPVLLNSDTVLEDDSLSRCAAWMIANPMVGATSPRLIGADGQPQQCQYSLPSVSDLFRVALRGKPRDDDGSTGWLAGTALVLRREALASIGGGLDDTFWMYWEDADLSARLLKAGWTLEPFQGGHIVHYGGASGGGDDSTRRADLHAWYLFGKYRWFKKHGGIGSRLGVYGLDAIDVVRKSIRGMVRPSKRGEIVHARVMLRSLWHQLLGRKPPIPGKARAA